MAWVRSEWVFGEWALGPSVLEWGLPEKEWASQEEAAWVLRTASASWLGEEAAASQPVMVREMAPSVGAACLPLRELGWWFEEAAATWLLSRASA